MWFFPFRGMSDGEEATATADPYGMTTKGQATATANCNGNGNGNRKSILDDEAKRHGKKEFDTPTVKEGRNSQPVFDVVPNGSRSKC
ncbi:hypothetical protein [Tunturiibacter gelidiferens]|uniref:hypothetical protein n=1 Tax=Tunturiibacter gelidiferens TaxID=3069689 RepID=UPI003D9BFB41